MQRTIAIANRKGGVAKTTTAVHLAHALARAGKRVLVIDCDSQRASVTTWIGPAEYETELADALQDPKMTRAAIVQSTAAGVDLLPGGPRTLEVERELTVRGTMATSLRRVLRELDKYDYVLLDCPPSLSGIVVSAFVAVDEILVPVTGRGMSVEALVEVLDLLKEIVEGELRSKAPEVRTLVTEFDGRLSLAQTVRAELASEAAADRGLRAYTTPIRRNERLAECYGMRRSIFDVDARAYGAVDYTALAAEVMG